MRLQILSALALCIICAAVAARTPLAVPFLLKTGEYQLVEGSTMCPLSNKVYALMETSDTGIFLVRIRSRHYAFIGADEQPLFGHGFPTVPSGFRNGIATLHTTFNGPGTYLTAGGKEFTTNAALYPGLSGEGLTAVAVGGRFGFISPEDGATVIALQYREVKSFSEGVAPAQLENGQWILIGKVNKRLPAGTYTNMLFSRDSTVAVQTADSLWGYIDAAVKMLITPRYARAGFFCNGIAIIREGAHWQLIDKSGHVLKHLDIEDAMGFHDGIASIKRNGLWGAINTKGEEMVMPRYKMGFIYQNGLARVWDEGLSFYIDAEGREYREQ